MTVERLDYGSADGSNWGGATTDKLGMYGVTPVTQQASANQAAVATTAITALVTTAATSTTPWGFAGSTQANAIATAVNSLITSRDAILVLLNQTRADLVALGAIKGAA